MFTLYNLFITAPSVMFSSLMLLYVRNLFSFILQLLHFVFGQKQYWLHVCFFFFFFLRGCMLLITEFYIRLLRFLVQI